MLVGIVTNLVDNTSHEIRLADAIECRLDYFDRIDLQELKALLAQSQKPVIFTLRNKENGGKFLQSEMERQNLIEKLFTLSPHYFDLEWNTDRAFALKLARKYPGVKIISSYHNFDQTPEDLHAILAMMEEKEFHGYKIAAQANSSLDALKIASFVKEKSKGINLTGIALGEKGLLTRILGPTYGNWMTYAPLRVDAKTAPGQINLSELTDTYNYKEINSMTAIYGLIGHPIERSLGHLVHNRVMQSLKRNAVYVKICVEKDELKPFMCEAQKIGFCGFSVTIPHKEEVIALLDKIDGEAEKIGAVNTVSWKEGKSYGYNTDGIGAVEALTKRVDLVNKTVVILGAGGAAKAIAKVVLEQGAKVIILNRNPDRAQKLGSKLGAEGAGLEKMEEVFARGYDVLINCTSEAMPISPKYICGDAYIMDIAVVPHENSLLSYAKNVIHGYEMYINQAIRQAEIWFQLSACERERVAQIIREVTLGGSLSGGPTGRHCLSVYPRVVAAERP